MKNSKAFSPIIIIIAVVVLAAGVIGYQYLGKSKGGGGAGKGLLNIGGPALNANCKLNDPDICRYMNRALQGDMYKGGFSGKSITTDKNGEQSESLWEISTDGKSHFITWENGKEVSEMINTGDATYIKDYTDGKWFKTSFTKTEGETKPDTSSIEEFKKKMQDEIKEKEDKITYKNLGKEPCGNMTCFKYQIIDPEVTDAADYIYFDDKEYLVRKTRNEDKDGQVIESTYEYKQVTITAPSPVKEMQTNMGAGTTEDVTNLLKQYQNQEGQGETPDVLEVSEGE